MPSLVTMISLFMIQVTYTHPSSSTKALLLLGRVLQAKKYISNLPETCQHNASRQLDKTMEVYIYDMVINARKGRSQLDDLQDLFTRQVEYKIGLKLTKCTFRVHSGKFLCYMMTRMGIEASVDQVKAKAEMPSPKMKKEIQQLSRRQTTLACFTLSYSNKYQTFFKIIQSLTRVG